MTVAADGSRLKSAEALYSDRTAASGEKQQSCKWKMVAGSQCGVSS